MSDYILQRLVKLAADDDISAGGPISAPHLAYPYLANKAVISIAGRPTTIDPTSKKPVTFKQKARSNYAEAQTALGVKEPKALPGKVRRFFYPQAREAVRAAKKTHPAVKPFTGALKGLLDRIGVATRPEASQPMPLPVFHMPSTKAYPTPQGSKPLRSALEAGSARYSAPRTRFQRELDAFLRSSTDTRRSARKIPGRIRNTVRRAYQNPATVTDPLSRLITGKSKIFSRFRNAVKRNPGRSYVGVLATLFGADVVARAVIRSRQKSESRSSNVDTREALKELGY